MKNTLVQFYVVSLSTGVALALMATSSSVLAAPQPSVEERLQRIERIIENPVLLQLSRRLGEQQREIQELQDQIDYLKRDLRKVNRLSDKRYKETDDRLSGLETATDKLNTQNEAYIESLSVNVPVIPPLNGMKNNTDLSMETTEHNEAQIETEAKTKIEATEPLVEEAKEYSSITTHPATESEQSAYQFAFSLIKNGEYDGAIQAFQSFLNNYKESELASNASYWMGEAFYVKQDYQKALEAFNVVINVYPYSSKVADAMLRAGDCLDNLKQLNKAKDRYAGLIALYPKTRAAEKAIKRLDKLQHPE